MPEHRMTNAAPAKIAIGRRRSGRGSGTGGDTGWDTGLDIGVVDIGVVDTGVVDTGAATGGATEAATGCGAGSASVGDILSNWWVVCAQKFSTAVSRLRTLSSVAVDFERSSWITPE
ncbi:MAG TPA: hypothetical protein VK687_12935 [Bryobacteraceae bacterium]|nr:hypothetical protein [Bryobacteraceae bacterium]